MELAVNEAGTLLADVDVEPLVCVADLIAMGCRHVWTDVGCTLEHPTRGSISTKVDNKCPEVEVPVALELIQDIERFRMDRQGTASRIKMLMNLVEDCWRKQHRTRMFDPSLGDG